MPSNSGNLKFAPDILRRLGEELIPNPEQGLIELVKNSYDADATHCTVYLDEVQQEGGCIRIEDDGDGMPESVLLSNFLTIGKSQKTPKKRTRLNRLPVGDKGLGRLAALRLGAKAKILSRPRASPGVEYVLTIDWDEVDRAATVESVRFDVEQRRTEKKPGVTIEISELYRSLNRNDVRRLSRELVLLSDPFRSETSFSAELKSQEYEEFERRVVNSYFDQADFVLEAHINENGFGSARLCNSAGQELFRTTLPLGSDLSYYCPSATFNLWIFILGSNFASKEVGITEVREWLRAVGGVHIYHRGLRVRPYGDPGFDWLDMNLSRAQHPEFRPSTNTVIGRVMIEDPELALDQPTNRIGFVETETFTELQRFAKDVLNWSSDQRLKVAEEERQRIKKSAQSKSTESLEGIRRIILNQIPQDLRGSVSKAVDELVAAKENEVSAVREDLQLYRSLATAGTTSAVFAHESAKPITFIGSTADTIERRAKKHLGDLYPRTFQEPVTRLRGICASLQSYSRFPIYHLKKSKRKTGPVDLREVWENTAALFKPLLGEAKIDITVDFGEERPLMSGSIALVEAIATNLITNSIHALTKSGARLQDRQIEIEGIVNSDVVTIIHRDNGPGIVNIDLDEIWLPGKTTNAQGTGFGLTIVRDSVGDLRGRVSAVPHGALGGAEFHVELPLQRESKK